MGSVIEGLPRTAAAAVDSVPASDVAAPAETPAVPATETSTPRPAPPTPPAATAAPPTPDAEIHPALAARKAAAYSPKQQTWREDRPVKIIVVGAGIGGVTAAVLLSQKVANATVTVYDRLDKVGGTWAANVYPGVRCDIPSHAYQLTFAPNRDWSEYYPKGAEIQQYYARVVAQYGLADRLRLRREVLRATWLPAAAQWAVEVRDLATDAVTVDTADVFVSAQGRISAPRLPSEAELPGLAAAVAAGRAFHPARWPAGLDAAALAGKRVAVIGAGASGQQVVCNLLRSARRIDHYVRSKTYITNALGADFVEASADQPGGPVYSAEQRRTFHDVPGAYVAFRRDFELRMQRGRAKALGKTRGDANAADDDPAAANRQARDRVLAHMRDRLGGDQAWLDRLTPAYAFGCKRPTPSPGYLEALVATAAGSDPEPGPDAPSPTAAGTAPLAYIDTPIARIDATGLVTADGTHRPADVIVAATGFADGYTPRFPVLGLDGVDLRDRWGAHSPVGYPETYLGVMAPGYPNFFIVLGAQGNAFGGAVPLQAEIAATYIAKAVRKLQSQSYAALHPRQDAADDFNNLVDPYFAGSAMLGDCASWSKIGRGPGGRVVIAWPGSFHHRVRALRDPRWEDFHFQRRPGAERNRFEYFGNGQTDIDESGDDEQLTNYLREYSELDARRHHEYGE